MDKVRFDGMDSYDEWGYHLAHKVIGEAEPKYNLVQVPGGVGYIDLTDALGVMGYNERELELTMKDIADHNEFIRHYSAMQAYIHGKRCKITLSDDPGYYWDGRCSVGAMEQDGAACYVTVVAICQPYKLKQSKTVVQDDSLTGEYKEILLSNDTMPTIPTITVQQETTIEYNGATYSINTGAHRLLDIILFSGGGTIKAKALGGSGSIKIEYQEGAL